MADINDLITKIRQELENFKVYIQADGGDVNFVDFKDGILTLEISGHCLGCASFDNTYTFGLKATLMDMHKEIKDVLFKVANADVSTYINTDQTKKPE